jgi:hypothetical protein
LTRTKYEKGAFFRAAPKLWPTGAMHFYINHTVQFEFALITRCFLKIFDRTVHLTRRFSFYFFIFLKTTLRDVLIINVFEKNFSIYNSCYFTYRNPEKLTLGVGSLYYIGFCWYFTTTTALGKEREKNYSNSQLREKISSRNSGQVPRHQKIQIVPLYQTKFKLLYRTIKPKLNVPCGQRKSAVHHVVKVFAPRDKIYSVWKYVQKN